VFFSTGLYSKTKISSRCMTAAEPGWFVAGNRVLCHVQWPERILLTISSRSDGPCGNAVEARREVTSSPAAAPVITSRPLRSSGGRSMAKHRQRQLAIGRAGPSERRWFRAASAGGSRRLRLRASAHAKRSPAKEMDDDLPRGMHYGHAEMIVRA